MQRPSPCSLSLAASAPRRWWQAIRWVCASSVRKVRQHSSRYDNAGTLCMFKLSNTCLSHCRLKPKAGSTCFNPCLQSCRCGYGLGLSALPLQPGSLTDTPLVPLQAKSGQDLLRALRHKFGSADNDDLENDPDAFSWDRLSQAVKGFFFTAPGA